MNTSINNIIPNTGQCYEEIRLGRNRSMSSAVAEALSSTLRVGGPGLGGGGFPPQVRSNSKLTESSLDRRDRKELQARDWMGKGPMAREARGT